MQTGVNELVEKMSINSLRHSKSVICIISIIIYLPAVAYNIVSTKVVHIKQIDLASVFVTAASLLCQCVIVNKQM